MLENTFIHLPNLGAATERSLWKQGCLTWRDLLGGLDRFSTGTASREDVEEGLQRSVAALDRREHQFFRRGLGLREAWRAFPDFRDSCAYLDIETDGGVGSSAITTIGIYDGKEFTCLVRGDNLGNFPDVISHYSMIVTFFGTGFDVPMLEKSFRSCRLDQIHFDLCPNLRRIGIRGGLKRIERQLGITRPSHIDGLTGMDAVRLWRKYERLGDESALQTLVDYNRADVVNLERLAEYAYKRLWRDTYLPTPAFDFSR